MSCLDAPAAILMNRSTGRSVVVELVGRKGCQPFGAGVRARVGSRVLIRDVPGGGSYLSTSDRRVYLAMGGAPRIDRLEVTWPSGRTESWRDVPSAKRVRLDEGSGTP